MLKTTTLVTQVPLIPV